MKINYLTTTVVLTCVLVSSGFAAKESVETINKDRWLSKLKEGVPAVICKNFTSNKTVNNQLNAKNIDYEKCITLIPEEFERCKSKVYSSMPENLDKAAAGEWGKKIGECIGNDFAEQHLGVVAPVASNSANDDNNNISSNSTTTPASTPASTDALTSEPTNTASDSSPKADDAGSDDSNQSMSRDEWLAKLKSAVPSLICQGFLDDKELNARLTKVNIDYNKCLDLLPASVDKCRAEFYSQLPATIDSTNAGKWGHAIGECIGKDFAINYLIGNKAK